MAASSGFGLATNGPELLSGYETHGGTWFLVYQSEVCRDGEERLIRIVSTTHDNTPGGGTANTAFLEDTTKPPGCPPCVSFGNANAALVDAIFWIETVAGQNGEPEHLQLQYTQLVQLDFIGIRWPHVTVATLRRQ